MGYFELDMTQEEQLASIFKRIDIDKILHGYLIWTRLKMKGEFKFMSKVLTTEQREQAGSDSYNRFEYQVHWIVCHIIVRLQEDAECIVFCEFHDDMAEYSPDNQQYQFFQIKTKEDSSDWTIAEMSKREKKKTGGYKKSFWSYVKI